VSYIDVIAWLSVCLAVPILSYCNLIVHFWYFLPHFSFVVDFVC
jgi:hypothetical protein